MVLLCTNVFLQNLFVNFKSMFHRRKLQNVVREPNKVLSQQRKVKGWRARRALRVGEHERGIKNALKAFTKKTVYTKVFNL